MTECEHLFAEGSEHKKICEGTSGRPRRVENNLRRKCGLDPLPDDKIEIVQVLAPQPFVTVLPRDKKSSKQGCAMCGGTQVEPVIAEGPGTELIQIFKSVGAPACVDCHKLAVQMNKWGDEECFNHLHEIVADILPRAIAWEKAKLGIFSKLIPEGLTEQGLYTIVNRAIELSKKKNGS